MGSFPALIGPTMTAGFYAHYDQIVTDFTRGDFAPGIGHGYGRPPDPTRPRDGDDSNAPSRRDPRPETPIPAWRPTAGR
jgi:hypothetical protein